MNENELFQAALGLLPPWLVSRCTFDESAAVWISIWTSRGAALPRARFVQPPARPTTRTRSPGGT